MYKPNYTYTFIYILIASVMLWGILFVIFSSLSNNVQSLMFLLPLSIYISSWVFCIPLVRIHFAVFVSEDGIRGPNGIIPFFSKKITLPWEQIQSIIIVDYFVLSFVKISHTSRDNNIFIPLGIDHLSEFSNAINKLSPNNSPLRLVYEKNIDKIGELKFIPVQLSGCCKDSHNKIFPLTPLILMKGEILINITKTDMKGDFFLETNLICGEYSLFMKTMDYKGELKIKIERGYYNNLTVILTRKS